MYNKKLTLSNGVEIPQLGLGTWFIDDDKVADAVKAAADLGYRHFDTAQAYGNERGVGEGIRTCGIPREKLFVVSKVAAEHKTYCQHCSKYYPRAKVRHINQKKRYNEQQRSQITA